MTDGGNISGSESATLSLSSVATDDEAGYDCVVTGDCGSITSEVALLSIQSSTSINELTKEDVLIYPNPTTGHLLLESFKSDIKKVSIKDLNGKLILEKLAISRKQEFDLSALPAGLYLIQIQLKKGVVTSKIIKE